MLPLYTSLRTFDRLGTDISQYMHFMYWSWRLFFALFLLNLSNIVINWEGRQLVADRFQVDDFLPAALTWHSLGNSRVNGVLARGAHSYVVIEFFTVGILVAYCFWLRGKFDEINTRIRNSDGGHLLTAADFTVMVSHVPEAWGSQQVRDFFERFGEVVHVGFSLNYRELILKIRRGKELREQHTNNCLDLLQLMGKLKKKNDIFKARQRARNSLKAVQENNKLIKALMRERYKCTGYAFVTFNKYQVAQAVLAELPKRLQGHGVQDRVSYLFGGHMRVRRAPEPNDVIWENLQCGPRERFLRQALTSAISFVLVVVGSLGIYISNLYIVPGMRVEVDSATTFIGLYLGSVLLIVAGHLIVFIIVPILVFNIERPHTKAAVEMSMMIKLATFMVINPLIIGLLFLFPFSRTLLNPYPNYHFSPGWYVTGGQVVLMSVVGDLVVINMGIELFRPGDLIRRRFARRAKTQQQMNELYACPGECILPYRIVMMTKTMVIGTMFSFGIPVFHAVIAIYMWMGCWVDRYTYLRRVTPPPISHSLLQMNVVLTYVLPIAILLHSFMAFKFLGDICQRGAVVDGVDYISQLFFSLFPNATDLSDSTSPTASLISEVLLSSNSSSSTCQRVLSEGGQCATLPSIGELDLDIGITEIGSIATLLGVDRELREEVEVAAGGVSLAPDSRVDLTCWLQNETGGGAVCVDASEGIGACQSQMEGSASYIFLVFSAFFYTIIVLFFVASNSKFVRKRDKQRLLERLVNLKTSQQVTDLWRIILQRDIKEPKIKAAPANAQMRKQGGSSSDMLADADASKPGPGTSPNRPSNTQLQETSLMYLPPLTTHLLNSYYDKSNTSNKVLEAYLQHYVAHPILEKTESQQEELLLETLETSRRSRACSSTAWGSTRGGGLDGDASERERASSLMYYASACGTIDGACRASRASGRVLSAGAEKSVKAVTGGAAGVKAGVTSVARGGVTAGATVVSAGAQATASSAASLQDNVRKLKQQLAQLESQITRITPRTSSRRASGGTGLSSATLLGVEGAGDDGRRRLDEADGAASEYSAPSELGIEIGIDVQSVTPDAWSAHDAVEGEAEGEADAALVHSEIRLQQLVRDNLATAEETATAQGGRNRTPSPDGAPELALSRQNTAERMDRARRWGVEP